jgi:ribosomal protein S18 acetylase RimI-like enzyme
MAEGAGEVVVRAARAEDAAAYRELRLRALRDHPEAFGSAYEEDAARPLAHWEERLAAPASPERAIFVAEAGGQLVGMAVGVRLGGAKLRHSADVYSVFVHPAWRGRGAGRLLIEACAAWAAEHGIEQLKLSVTAANAPAVRLYERCGFTAYGRDPRVIRVGGADYDELLMVRQVGAPGEGGA